MRLVYTPAFSTHAVCFRVFSAPCIFQQDQSVVYRLICGGSQKASFLGYSMWRRSCALKRAEGLFYEESRGDNPRHQLLPNHPLFGNISSRGSLFPSRLFGHSYVTFPLLCSNTWAYRRSSCRTLDTCTHYVSRHTWDDSDVILPNADRAPCCRYTRLLHCNVVILRTFTK